MRILALVGVLLACACAWSWAGEAEVKQSPWSDPDAKDVEKLDKEMHAQLSQEFSYKRVGPWLMASDMEPEALERFANSTIAYFAAGIQRQLFTKHARSEAVKILLFKDAESYIFWNQKLFSEKPTTPYGYFSRTKRALVMNIGTGGGTLLHEMVHAMAEEDFPLIPTWLNEGLGSLYEASNMDRSGRVVGVANWRLNGLLADLAKGKQVGLADLFKTDSANFYGESRGANYATSRYLMQYLQKEGKLEAFYTSIRDGKFKDGGEALRAVFENKRTLDEIEKDLFAWVKTLK